jgi:hypothetical protein
VTCVTIAFISAAGPECYRSEFLYDYIVATNAANIVPGVYEGNYVKWVEDHHEHFCERYHDHR